MGGCPTGSLGAGSSLCCGILCWLPRDTAPVARGQPGCACSTASLPRSPLVSPSLSSLQSNLLNSPCPRARSVHFHDVFSVCPHAAHRGSPPPRRSGGGSCLSARKAEERGGSSPQVFCDARAGVSHRGLIAGKVCQERRELGLRKTQGALNWRGQWGGWWSKQPWGGCE